MTLRLIYVRNTSSLKAVKLPSTCQLYISEYHETFPICYYFLEILCTLRLILLVAGVLINPWPDKEGNKPMFLSEWCEFPSAPCLAGKNEVDDSSRLDVVEIVRVPDLLTCFLPGRAKDLSAPGILLQTNERPCH